MKRVVVLGATGSLGSAIATQLTAAGHTVIAASRRGPTRVDVATGEGLAAALAGADVVMDATNDSVAPRAVLVDGTGRVLAAAREAGVGHFVGISIVGIDDAPIPYYRAKVEQERVIEASPVPWTLLRATQFHDLIPKFAAPRRGIVAAPLGWKLQPIHVREVASVLVAAAAAPAAGRLPDVAGPQVLPFARLARMWRSASRTRALVVPVPLLGARGAFLRSGKLCAPDRAVGTITFAQWLAERYPV